MKRHYYTISRIIILMGVVLFASLVCGFSNNRYRKTYNNLFLFEESSPDNGHTISVAYGFNDSAGYGEYDEISLIDSNGCCNATFIIFVPNSAFIPADPLERVYENGAVAMHADEDSFVVDWSSDGVSIGSVDTDYSICLKYDDIEDRSINEEPQPQLFRIAIVVLSALFCIVLGIRLFCHKNEKILSVVLFVLLLMIPICLKLSERDSKLVASVSCGEVRNNNIRVASGKLDRLLFDLQRDNERIILYTIARGDVDSAMFDVQEEDDIIHIDINGEDSICFDIISR